MVFSDEFIEDAATALLAKYEREFGVIRKPPVPVEDLAEQFLDLNILWDEMKESEGSSLLAGLSPSDNTVVFNEGRRKVLEETSGLYYTVLAHEIGHWALHVDHAQSRQRPLPTFEHDEPGLFRELGGQSDPREREAHRFMAYLLMPASMIWRAVEDVDLINWPTLYELRDRFQVTISALTIRLTRLGILFIDDGAGLHRSWQEYHGQTRML